MLISQALDLNSTSSSSSSSTKTAMDYNDGWSSVSNGMFGLGSNGIHTNQADANGSEVDDENMDFYGESEAHAGV